mmetsp:Transcript_36934/g.61213  ORF Transcript_36934/g.61213 Transcript_36934/m.61213 type:complete len:190 (+) Transcript_36934:9-578(+)
MPVQMLGQQSRKRHRSDDNVLHEFLQNGILKPPASPRSSSSNLRGSEDSFEPNWQMLESIWDADRSQDSVYSSVIDLADVDESLNFATLGLPCEQESPCHFMFDQADIVAALDEDQDDLRDWILDNIAGVVETHGNKISRLAKVQARALKESRDNSLVWQYSDSDELLGAYCDGIWFSRKEIEGLTICK